jgi:pimeloyl-ACP methyl ester carboxylesterase
MILARPDGTSTAYCYEKRQNPPGIVFLPGFRSDMGGTKATALAAHCRERNQTFLRFDYFGHGASSGDFREGSIGRWLEDALAVVDQLAEGPQVLVGSSMGGWIAFLAALARPARIAGLLCVAPAPDFTEDLVWNRLSQDQRRRLLSEGQLQTSSTYEPEPITITRKLVEEGRRHLLLRAPIRLSCPVRLLHGMRDNDVPYQTSLRLLPCLEGADVGLELIEDGEHRLSRPQDLQRIFAALDRLSGRARA